ncbi:hypothetical protein [Streptomyces sp. C184]|uniref:hypothetical protein n=1 Tax=Streptomyces sp. C184 TaxID=3237121 RepID=UPI0034C5D3F8
MSHNLLRAAGALAGAFHAKAMTVTIRVHLVHVPAPLRTHWLRKPRFQLIPKFNAVAAGRQNKRDIGIALAERPYGFRSTPDQLWRVFAI